MVTTPGLSIYKFRAVSQNDITVTYVHVYTMEKRIICNTYVESVTDYYPALDGTVNANMKTSKTV